MGCRTPADRRAGSLSCCFRRQRDGAVAFLVSVWVVEFRWLSHMTAAVLCQVGGGEGQVSRLYDCPYTQMFLGLPPEIAVEEGREE